MKKTISYGDFEREFEAYNRAEQFSQEGLEALFNWLESHEEDTGEEIELDVIALCCEFTEYESLEELQESYTDIESLDDLYDRTQVI